tara:strand:- start:1202 stop:1336 length:135 start_codon:yes stop_codon:yes gene_type:complete
MCSNADVVVDVPAPEEPVTAIIGFCDDMETDPNDNIAILYGELT